MRTEALLARLVTFPTVSAASNLDLIGFVEAFLSDAGILSERFPDAEGRKASLFASTGPLGSDGIVLSAHSDVVPAAGQAWRSDPFRLAERDGKLFGRGAADMKGFLACALNAMAEAAGRDLARPLHLALSHDEEIGCVGVRPMLDGLKARGFRARFALVGEPTSMRLALGHKGKLAARTVFTGVAGHSASAPEALNALHMAADFIGALRGEQGRLAESGARDEAYDAPFSTVHAGRMSGGTALNIVPDRAEIEWEIRAIGGEDGQRLYDRLARAANGIAETQRARFPAASAETEVVNAYPGLDEPAASAPAREIAALLDDATPVKVAFGTEAGLFREKLGIPALVCGPGSMAQGHKADEFVSREQFARCSRFLGDLVDTLRT